MYVFLLHILCLENQSVLGKIALLMDLRFRQRHIEFLVLPMLDLCHIIEKMLMHRFDWLAIAQNNLDTAQNIQEPEIGKPKQELIY